MPELDTQCGLPFELDERGLQEQICLLTGKPVSLSITSNRVSVLSVRYLSGRRDAGGLNLRLHRIFLKAGPDVIREIARFIKNGKKGSRFPLLTQYIKANEAELKKTGKRREGRLKTLGRYHDLLEIYGSLNTEYFEGRVACAITWGKRPPPFRIVSGKPGAVRKRTLGSFSCDGMGPGRGLIRINPVLDKKNVPSYYVRFVVYHEMLHADMGACQKNGRRCMHHAPFKQRERLFRDFDRATAYEKDGKKQKE